MDGVPPLNRRERGLAQPAPQEADLADQRAALARVSPASVTAASTLAERTLAARDERGSLEPEPLLLAGLRELTEFLPVFDRDGYGWSPYPPELFEFEERVYRFESAFKRSQRSQGGPLAPGHPLSRPSQRMRRPWMTIDKFRRFWDDHDLLDDATPLALAVLLFKIIRVERVNEGVLGGAGETGLLVAILRRAALLAGSASGGEHSPEVHG